MLVPFVVAGVVIVGLLVRHDITVSRLLEAHAKAEHEWALERSELVTRAMHPQVVLPPRSMQPAAPADPPQPDQFELVGHVFTGDES